MSSWTIGEAAEFLKAAQDVLILCHRNPDGDTTGSGYGLYHCLRALGKRAAILCNDPLPPKLTPLAMGYQQEEFTPKTVVSVDIADEQLFGEELSPYLGKVDLAIDHHPSHTFFAKHTCLQSDSAATCEIVYLICKGLGGKIPVEAANCFYTGIATDTGCFMFATTSPRTHRIAADLVEAGCNFKAINKRMFETKSMALVELERQVMTGLRFYAEGQIAVLVITREMLASVGISEAELDGIAGITRKIEGVEVGITIKERDDGEYKISLRTSEKVNASEVCQRFGGGGHMRAAGCTLYGALEEVQEKMLAAVVKALDNLAV